MDSKGKKTFSQFLKKKKKQNRCVYCVAYSIAWANKRK